LRINLKVENDKQVEAEIKRYKLNQMNKVKRVVNKTAARIERNAKKLAPVSPGGGRLRSSIHIRPFRGDELDLEVGTNVFYGVYQEYGTGKYAVGGNGRKTPWAYVNEDGVLIWTAGSKPQPFLNPSFELVRPRFVPDLKKALKG
jgi:HK97 gp10 family phage protein